jgi:hypothetical protein
VLASTLGVAVAAVPAAQPTDSWRRIVTADGVAAVTVPCAEDRTKSGIQSGTSVMMCQADGLAYMVFVGGSEADGGPLAKSFDQNLAEAKADPDTGQVDLIEIAGHKAFRAAGRATESVVLAEFVDYRKGQSIFVMAKEEPDGNLSSADRPAAVDRAQRFVGSLEVLAK